MAVPRGVEPLSEQ